ncbi:hypothetical protein BDU57DRAFT_201622 [Ampelomyces quisqualis]|uniref:Uncharacterized protein n=1 Tax=Ampelomyces quisqualis TaxID=50730 RepID=A0A6A5QXC0_AMPQU|nr:hypothetical protein BDU57DRAFT_201622 [Ampelomyces quisqualis]
MDSSHNVAVRPPQPTTSAGNHVSATLLLRGPRAVQARFGGRRLKPSRRNVFVSTHLNPTRPVRILISVMHPAGTTLHSLYPRPQITASRDCPPNTLEGNSWTTLIRLTRHKQLAARACSFMAQLLRLLPPVSSCLISEAALLQVFRTDEMPSKLQSFLTQRKKIILKRA